MIAALKGPTTNKCRNIKRLIVIPAKAGIQGAKATAAALDPRFREGDDTLLIMLVSFRAASKVPSTGERLVPDILFRAGVTAEPPMRSSNSIYTRYEARGPLAVG